MKTSAAASAAPAAGLVTQAVSDLIDVSARAGTLGSIDEPSKAKLQAAVVDAFERGEIHAGIQLLVSRAPTERATGSLNQLVDSALQVLGIDPQLARAGFKLTLEKLGTTEPHPTEISPRTSPARDAFRGIRVAVGQRTSKILKRLSAEQARIDTSIEQARVSASPVDALRSIAAKLDLRQASDQTLMGLVSLLVNVNAFNDVLAVLDAAPKEFASYPIPQRARALALLQKGQAEDARVILEGLITRGEAMPAAYGLLGKVFLSQRDQALIKGDDAGAAALLDKAIDAYRRGFHADPSELYPGVALPALLEMKGDLPSRKEAVRFASVMETLALQRASFGERHYWDHAAVLTMALVSQDGKKAQKYLDRLMTCAAEPWMVASTREHLARVLELRTERGEKTKALKNVIDQLDAWKPASEASVPIPGSKAIVPEGSDEKLAALLNCAYRFGGRSSKRLSGNYAFDGIAHDIRVTPADIVYFTRIVKAAGIDKVEDPIVASSKMDAVIREHFATANMELINSEAHKRFDQVMPRLAQFMGATHKSSQTNVSADWINRLADCRQHAPAKLLLFEAWKRMHVRDLMVGIDRATRESKPEEAKLLEQKLMDLSASEMRILDARIADASSNKPLEEHTATILIQRKPVALGEEMNQLQAVHLADSFYQSVYPLGGGRAEIETSGGLPRIHAPKKTESGRSIVLLPAHYSFDRASSSVDFGQLKFRGVQVASPGWESEVPVGGIDLGYLHAFAATVS